MMHEVMTMSNAITYRCFNSFPKKIMAMSNRFACYHLFFIFVYICEGGQQATLIIFFKFQSNDAHHHSNYFLRVKD
jgi:hypothetical protein